MFVRLWTPELRFGGDPGGINRIYLLLDGKLIAIGSLQTNEEGIPFRETYIFEGEKVIHSTFWVFVDGFQLNREGVETSEPTIVGDILISAPKVEIRLHSVSFNFEAGVGEGLAQAYQTDIYWRLSKVRISATDTSPPKSITEHGFQFKPYPLNKADSPLSAKLGDASSFEERLFIFQNGRLILEGGDWFEIKERPDLNSIKFHSVDVRDVRKITLSEIEQSVLSIDLNTTFGFQSISGASDAIVLSGSRIAISSRHLCCVTDRLELKRSKSGKYLIDPSQIESLRKLSAEQKLVKKNIPFFYKKDCIARGAFMLNSREIIAIITVTSLLLLMVTVVFRRWSNKRKLKLEKVATTVGLQEDETTAANLGVFRE